jgi:hypothetical protein
MSVRNKYILSAVGLSLGIFILPHDFIELTKVYIVSTIAYATIVFNILYHSDQLMGKIAERFAEILVQRYRLREVLEEIMKKHQNEIHQGLK